MKPYVEEHLEKERNNETFFKTKFSISGISTLIKFIVKNKKFNKFSFLNSEKKYNRNIELFHSILIRSMYIL